jgi:beta-mannanase
MKNKLIKYCRLLLILSLSPFMVNAATVDLPGYVNVEDYERFYDTTQGNAGTQYRNDNVDIGGTNDAGGGFIVGWTDNGEWLEYDINITQAGTYTAEVRVASSPGNGEFTLIIDGDAKGGSHNVSSTGGWDDFDSLFAGLGSLSQGNHTFQFKVEKGGFNVNWVKFIREGDAGNDNTSSGNNNASSGNSNGVAPLEPADGKVIYGMGQDGITLGGGSNTTTQGQLKQIYNGIWNINEATGKYPMLRHFYVTDYDSGETTFEGRLGRLTNYNSSYSHDYIGLFSFKFEQQQDVWDLLNGLRDDEIRAIGRAAAENGRKMFFRPFYEFNQYGDSSKVWDAMDDVAGKSSEQWFIDAWKKFRGLVREGVDEVNGDKNNIAFVWCLLAANPTDYQAFYPGDDQVDWIGMDIFSTDHLELASNQIIDWVKSSTNRGDGKPKPVILPEVQPALIVESVGNYSTQGKQNSVDKFFNPLFDFMESNNEVKALIYMNFWFNKLYTDGGNDWVKAIGLDQWGDGRIHPTAEGDWDSTVFDFVTGKIGSSTYLAEGQDNQLK